MLSELSGISSSQQFNLENLDVYVIHWREGVVEGGFASLPLISEHIIHSWKVETGKPPLLLLLLRYKQFSDK